MKILRTIKSYEKWWKVRSSQNIGFVPTMGALHEGHLSLIHRSRKENKVTVVSVFVNPTQFGPNEDFKKYPRPWKKDLALLKKAGVAAVFSPKAEEMVPPNGSTVVSVKGLNSVLCGAPTSRGPGHFDGVATIVSQLFNIVRPTRAYFGLKDYQQVRVIETMVRDLHMKVQVVRCPTLREKDGLALSSRNIYLNRTERFAAPLFYAALQYGRKLLTSKSKMTPQEIRRKVKSQLASIPNIRVEYVELVNPDTFQAIKVHQRPILLAAAIRLGKTRLIDNLIINK